MSFARCFLAASAAFVLFVGCGGGSDSGGDLPDASFPDGSRTDRDAGTVGRDAGSRDAGPDVDGGPCSAEICDDGLDNDCNGLVDDGCACLPGTESDCYRGSVESRGVGRCAAGTMVCEDGLEFGTWGACEGDVIPEEEVCDTAEVDEDCDGSVNEGCECTGDEPLPCGSDVGACGQGLQECIDGMRGECIGATEPTAEMCNGIDDDCDGEVDEGLTRTCGSDVGECSLGTQACVDGDWEEACTGGRRPAAEACDGLDNDCDGETDEELTRDCGSDVGACSAGSQICEAGGWSMCTGEVRPSLETCDGTDEDCDGTVDEGVTGPCGTDEGECSAGTATCVEGGSGEWGACTGGTLPADEVCDGLDNDCDGTADEGCLCSSPDTRRCGTTDEGVCEFGTQTCDISGSWGSCTGAVGPTAEVCNGLDDDCDGTADEGDTCPTAPPVITCGGGATAEVLSTVTVSASGSDPDGGSVTYAWTVLSRPTGSTSSPTPSDAATANLYLDASGTYELEVCVTDDEGETACCNVTVVSTPPGTIHVELSWDTAYGDVDLHFLNVTRTAPDGWWTTDDCYFLNKTPDWGPAGADANPSLDIDDTDGYGPENTTIDVNPQSGTYGIAVHYFCEHSLGSATPAGPTDATVRIFCDGALIQEYTGISLSGTDDWNTIAEVDYPSCTVRRVNRRTNGTQTLPASFTSPRHCEIRCSTDADCPTGERCARVGGGGPPRLACILD